MKLETLEFWEKVTEAIYLLFPVNSFYFLSSLSIPILPSLQVHIKLRFLNYREAW